ncbi:hypothetical protein FGB62_3g232 [Gracilaria domingensis]|nr:hypothetical protein FGB62_3g232 [Gracilaria domingensis]
MTLAAAPMLVEVANCMEEKPELQGRKRKRSNGLSEANILAPGRKRTRRQSEKAVQGLRLTSTARQGRGSALAKGKKTKRALPLAEQARFAVGRRRRSRHKSLESSKTSVQS